MLSLMLVDKNLYVRHVTTIFISCVILTRFSLFVLNDKLRSSLNSLEIQNDRKSCS